MTFTALSDDRLTDRQHMMGLERSVTGETAADHPLVVGGCFVVRAEACVIG
ncbi:hypothetical protein [Nocardia salmonicida]|uniref:hypothetical protein n=1 Tax=Nocardia salmonicida TaxID=53431 RepID=UPI0013F4F87F|nr:hypothetical protein [Nocardia salmonicida]